jgi:hypothetical protein
MNNDGKAFKHMKWETSVNIWKNELLKCKKTFYTRTIHVGKCNITLMEVLAGVIISDILRGKISYPRTSYVGSTVCD